MNDADTKKCSACGFEWPRSEYYRCRTSSDGLQARCKPCDKEALRALASRPPKQEEQPVKRGRGRPRKDTPARYRNITVDHDVLDHLNDAGAAFEKRVGFKPTLSQLIRWLVHNARRA